MSRNNDVHKVLVAPIDGAVAAVGTALSVLPVGRLGVYDAETNLAIDGSAPTKNFYFAVGVDKDGSTDYEFSAGQAVQIKNVVARNEVGYVAPVAMVSQVAGFGDADCDVDLNVKIELRDQEIYRIQGYNQFSKSFSIRTPCCVGAQTVVDGNAVAIQMVDEINLDDTGAFVATYASRSAVTIATHGTSANFAAGDAILLADVQALELFNATAVAADKVYTDIVITFAMLNKSIASNVNLKYFKPRFIIGIVTPLEDFTCIGAVASVLTEAVAGSGSGYDVKQMEYHSQLDGNGPYVVSESTGTANERVFYAIPTANYDLTSLEYDHKTLSGWQDYSNPLRTVIATIQSNAEPAASLSTLLDALLPGV